MKIERKKTKFMPVIITLETEDELESLFNYLEESSLPMDKNVTDLYQDLAKLVP